MNTVKIEVTEQELDIIGKALAQLPYGVVAHLIAKLAKQITHTTEGE